MNILPLNNFNLQLFGQKNNTNKRNVTPPNFNLKFQTSLKQDTITFSGTQKVLLDRTSGISLATAKGIYKIAEPLQEEIEGLIKGIFKEFIVSDKNPNGIIKEIKGRVKTPESIVEKSATRDWDSKSKIFTYMTDLNGIKIILNKTDKKSVQKILKKLTKKINENTLFLDEVENKRPKAAKKLKGELIEKWDYAYSEDLEEFVANAQTHNKRKTINFLPADYTNANYSAIHFLLRLPGQTRNFELQLMGSNVARFKDLDDLLFKILNNKNINSKFRPIENLLEPILLSKYEKDLLKYIKIIERINNQEFTNEELKLIKLNIYRLSELEKDINNDLATKLKKLKLTESDLEILMSENTYSEDAQNKKLLTNLKKKEQMLKAFNEYRANSFIFQRNKQCLYNK